MLNSYLNFLRGVSVPLIGRIGVILTTSSVISFFFFEAMRLAGIWKNAYMGLITYLAFPVIFLVGLVLIPVGWAQYRKERQKSTRELLNETFDEKTLKARISGSKLFRIMAVLTLFNVLIFVGASARMLHFMEEPNFCGTACHTVMNPEWTTYQVSPHARVACVDCHVGEGVTALINSKLNGMRQMFLAAFNAYNRPIPTPVHQLRPARETCEKCHWPEKFYGLRISSYAHYAADSLNTVSYNTLVSKIDTESKVGSAGIHWHISDQHEIRYASIKDERETMIWVVVEHSDGRITRYENIRLNQRSMKKTEPHIRVMDCVDCHNRVTHIYKDPGRVIDESLENGTLDASVPYLKQQSLQAIRPVFASLERGLDHIESQIRGYYQRQPASQRPLPVTIEHTVDVLQNIYRQNIHPEMKIEWNTYPSHIGHNSTSEGCFRCHNQNMVNAKQQYISNDCTLCHAIVAFGSPNPYQNLLPPDSLDRERSLQHYLRQDVLNTIH